MKTTKQHFKIFINECEKWITKFELHNWTVVYEHKDLGNRNAQNAINALDHIATIGLTNEIDTCFERKMSFNEYIKSLAKHEVLHLLLGDMVDLAYNRYIQEDELKICEESLVIKLSHIL